MYLCSAMWMNVTALCGEIYGIDRTLFHEGAVSVVSESSSVILD